MSEKEELELIDKQIASLFVKRLSCDLSGKEGGEQRRKRLNILADETKGDYTYAKVLFDTIDDLSLYRNGRLGGDTPLTESIKNAIINTPKLFPKRAKVACQGVEGAYSQKACDKVFPLADITYVNTFKNVFQAVESGMCDYGIVPIENSNAGSVNAIYDLLGEYKTYIVRSVKLLVEHVLLAKEGVKESDIKEVFSHEQAINQCGEYLKAHKNIKVNVASNTAVSAKAVAESERLDVGAIASVDCAKEYGLKIVSDKILNSDNNYTRFICIAKSPEIYPGANKTSIVFSTENKPGALYRVLFKFASLGINVTKLESRPRGKEFNFNFYFDLDCSVYDENFLTLIADLEKSVSDFKYFGSYSEIN